MSALQGLWLLGPSFAAPHGQALAEVAHQEPPEMRAWAWR